MVRNNILSKFNMEINDIVTECYKKLLLNKNNSICKN